MLVFSNRKIALTRDYYSSNIIVIQYIQIAYNPFFVERETHSVVIEQSSTYIGVNLEVDLFPRFEVSPPAILQGGQPPRSKY